MSNNHSQKFYCYSCNKETLGIISDVQTSRGINQCIICTNCLDKINKKVDELIKEAAKAKIDPTTKFVVGSKEYNDYYYPKFDEKGMHR